MSNLFNNLVRDLKRERKKAYMVSGLMAVMLLLWGRLILKEVPRTASASPAKTTASVKKTAKATAVSQVVSLRRPAVYLDLPATPARDLFVMDRSLYPQSSSDEPQVVPKSGAESADDTGVLEALTKSLRGLTLQTTVLGASPRAVINGKVVRPGEVVNGLTLSQVHPRYVVLEKDGRRLKLEM